jgi:TonB family protein
MRLLVRVALLASLFSGLSFLCLAQDSKTTDGPSPPPAAREYDSNNWTTYSAPEGGYTILLPGTPEPSEKREPQFVGSFPQYFHQLKTETGDYKIGFFDFMAEMSDSKSSKSLIEASRMQFLAANKKWKLLSESELRVEGSEGREWLIKDADRILRIRHFFIGTRYYQLTLTVHRFVAFHTGKPSSNSSDFTDLYKMIATRFFDSFKTTQIIVAAANENETTGEAQKRIVSFGVLNGKAVKLPQPVYPLSAKSAGVQGSVAVEVVIDENGRVIDAKAVSGPPVLRRTAEEAAMGARFTPVKIEGVPVRVTGIINYNFLLH